MSIFHYVYRITNISAKKHYYGCRSSEIHPSLDLGRKYFSSSKDKEFLQEQEKNKEHFKYKVIRIFQTREDALSFEIKLHTKFNVDKNPSFYNRAKQTTVGFYYTNKGAKFSKETREKMSIKSRNKSESCRKLISEKVKLNWANMTEEKRKQKSESISKALMGKPQPEWKNKQHSERMSGSGNSKAKIIHIFDNLGNLVFKCHGNFKQICLENSLPHVPLRKSHVNNGSPLFKTFRSKLEAEKRGWTHYEDWYAIEIK